MAFNPSSPLTGTIVAGLTSPTFTLTSDQPTAPVRQKQWIVTALGGTQTGVETHSLSKPFVITATKPEKIRLQGAPDSLGRQRVVYYNKWNFLTRIGCKINAAGQVAVARYSTDVTVPVGAETYDPVTIRSGLSCHAGMLVNQADGIVSTVTVGTI